MYVDWKMDIEVQVSFGEIIVYFVLMDTYRTF